MSDVSILYKSCASYLAKWTTFLLNFRALTKFLSLQTTNWEKDETYEQWWVLSWGAWGKTKMGAPLMMSSYSVIRDKHFWSSLRYGHRRIGLRSCGYDMTDIAGEHAKGCSWYKILITLKNGKTRLATHKS